MFHGQSLQNCMYDDVYSIDVSARIASPMEKKSEQISEFTRRDGQIDRH